MQKTKSMSRNLTIFLSYLVAIALWLAVSIFVNPETTRIISKIPVKLSASTAAIDTLGLSIVEMNTESVSIELSGSRLALSGLNADDFSVTPILTGINSAGMYTLDLRLENLSGADVDVISVSPSMINVTIAHMSTVTIPVTCRINGDVPDGYFLDDYSVSVQNVTITGPDDAVARIASAVVNVDSVRDGIFQYGITLLNASGNPIDDDTLSCDVTNANVKISMLKTKTVNLIAKLTDLPSTFDASAVTLTVETGELVVAGTEHAIDNLADTICVKTYSLSEIFESSTEEIELSFANGVHAVDGSTTAIVNIEVSSQIVRKYFDISNFNISEYLKQYNVTVETKKLRGVMIVGPAEEIDAINVSDIIATVVYDETQMPQKGRYNMDIVISSNETSNCWVVGKYEVSVKVE